MSETIDFHSWDSLFVRLIGSSAQGASRDDLDAGMPHGVADKWLADATSRGLVERRSDRVFLTPEGKADYEALPPDTNRLTIGLPDERDDAPAPRRAWARLKNRLRR